MYQKWGKKTWNHCGRSYKSFGILWSSFSVSLSLPSVSMSLSLCLCLCLLLWLWWWWSERRRGGGEETNRTIRWLIPAKVLLQIAETEQPCQVKRQIFIDLEMWAYTSMYLYMYKHKYFDMFMYIYIYSVILEVFWVRQRVYGFERWWTLLEKDTRWWRLVAILTFTSFVMLGGKGAETEQLHQGKRMIGGIGDMFFSISSHTWKWERSKSFFGEPLKHVKTVRGQIWVSRADDDPLPPVCGFKNVPVCTFETCSFFTSTTRTCFNTCARGAGMHGDVLNVHTDAFLKPKTGFSSFFQRAATHATTTNNTTTTTTHATQHNTQHHTETQRATDRERQRETESKKVDKERQRKQDKTRQEKMIQYKKIREDERGRDKTREEKMKEEETRQEKRRWKRKREKKWKRKWRGRDERKDFFWEKCLRTPNLPDELAQNVS